MASAALQRVSIFLAGANARDGFNRRDEDLAVTYGVGARGLADDLDGFVGLFRSKEEFDFEFGNEIDFVFGAAVDFLVAALAAEALDLVDGQAADAEPGQRLLDLIEFERFDDAF